jgi:hypothetical protein
LRYAQHGCFINNQQVRTFRPQLESLKRSRLESDFV